MNTRDIVRNPHGQVGEQRALQPQARNEVVKFITELANRHAHVLPMYLSAANGQALGPDESVLIFPPSFSKRGMSNLYRDAVKDKPELLVSERQFSNILAQIMERASRAGRQFER